MQRITTRFAGLVDPYVDSDIGGLLKIQLDVGLDLSKLTDGAKRQITLNLSRGYCSATGSVQYKAYCMLAALLEFPVFAFGRGADMVLSVRDGADTNAACEQLQTLWKLAKKPDDELSWRQQHFHARVEAGPCPGFKILTVRKPPNFNIKGACAALGYESVFDIVPKEKTLEATSMVQRGVVINARMAW